MAMRCENCNKSVGYGHAVSHAKVRLKRFFKPNLQKLKVLKNGISIRVKFCTSCIKRLKKDGHIGQYTILRYKAAEEGKMKKVSLPKVEKPSLRETEKPQADKEKKTKIETVKTPKAAKALDMDEIIGKKS